MKTNKYLLLSLVLCLGLGVYGAETVSDIEFPKPPAYRVGISAYPEKQYIQAIEEKLPSDKNITKVGDSSNNATAADLTYADLSIKRLSKEIAQELEYEETDMVADLSLLWQGAATQSDTINFALYKLANPDADKPDSKSLKNILTTIASMSTLVGASISNPMLAGSSLIGGNILNIMSQDTKALNYKYTKVNDADMIILIRKIEDLQQNAVNLYYDYMCAKKQLAMTQKLVEDRKRKFELAQKNNAQRELIVITDAYYRTALDKQRTAKSEFFSKRAALEQFVGNETFVQFEAELTARENGEQPPKTITPEQEEEYQKTVTDVENYTKSMLQDELKAIDILTQDTTPKEEDYPISTMPLEQKLFDLDENGQPKQIVAEENNDYPIDTMPIKEKLFELDENGVPHSITNESTIQPKTKNVKTKTPKTKTKKESKKTFAPLTPVSPTLDTQKPINGTKFIPLDDFIPNREGGYSIHAE